MARVGDQCIGVVEFHRLHNQLVDIYRQQLGDNFEQFASQLNLPVQAINSLISEYSVALHARSLGLEAADSEVSDRITSFPAFQDEQGNFVGMDRYRRVLQINGLSTSQWAEHLRV